MQRFDLYSLFVKSGFTKLKQERFLKSSQAEAKQYLNNQSVPQSKHNTTISNVNFIMLLKDGNNQR